MRQFLHDHKLRPLVNRHQALAGFIACLVIIGFTIGYVAREAGRTKHALCALRGDLEQRIDSSTRFLVEHPNGIPGVTPKLIRDGITNQRRTVKALHGLHCD